MKNLASLAGFQRFSDNLEAAYCFWPPCIGIYHSLNTIATVACCVWIETEHGNGFLKLNDDSSNWVTVFLLFLLPFQIYISLRFVFAFALMRNKSFSLFCYSL